MKNKKFYFELLSGSWKIKCFKSIYLLDGYFFFYFRVTNSNLKNIKLHFELLNQFWLYWKFNCTSALYHLRVIKRKLVYFLVTHQTKLSLHYNQLLFSLLSFCFLSWICYMLENQGHKIKFSIFVCKKHWLSNQLMVSLLNYGRKMSR